MKIVIPMLVVTLLYNPIFPVHLDEFDFYIVLNIVAGIVLLWCAFQRAKLFAIPKINVEPAIEKIREKDPELLKQIEAMGKMNEFLIQGSLDEDSKKICSILGLQSINEEIREYTRQIKMVYMITDDKSFDRMALSIRFNAPVDLTDEDCKKIYEALTGTKIEASIYQGGDGSDESPVIVCATKSRAGIDAEYAWISQRHGEYGKDWNRKMSISYTKGDGTPCTSITAATTDGAEFTYHFDTSRFFGKW